MPLLHRDWGILSGFVLLETLLDRLQPNEPAICSDSRLLLKNGLVSACMLIMHLLFLFVLINTCRRTPLAHASLIG